MNPEAGRGTHNARSLDGHKCVRGRIGATGLPQKDAAIHEGLSQEIEWLVHGKPSEVSASALHDFFGIELKAVAVKECFGGKAGVGGDGRNICGH